MVAVGLATPPRKIVHSRYQS
ncbi:hypothetical protein E2C01_043905 [Portunus trituberculatus]|uniref:Uncharacterized protein n=1 Tax=Portunus trituberculatus TaxID=210409 RepID=A0A5B7FYJ6_PORTR|nr:hypothetical protein [Portunus trituberculatus]